MKIRVLIAIVLVAAVAFIGSLSLAEAHTGREITGSVTFPAPPEWGIDLTLWIDFDLQEVNASNHRATGEINWRIWNDEFGWRELDSHPSCVLFGADVGEDPDTAIVVTRITHKSGWGDGLPGEYAYWWLRDSGEGDQLGINDYSFDPFYEFFPRGKPPECAYFGPGLIIEVGEGLEFSQ